MAAYLKEASTQEKKELRFPTIQLGILFMGLPLPGFAYNL